MSATRSRKATEPPKLVRPPEFGTCNFYVEAVGRAFDPKRFLLRHFFSVGFYPTRNYQPFVEFGAVQKWVDLPYPQRPASEDDGGKFTQNGRVRLWATNITDANMATRLNRTGSLRVTRLYLYKQYINVRLVDLQYLLKLFLVVHNQPNVYTLSLPNVLPYDCCTNINYICRNYS